MHNVTIEVLLLSLLPNGQLGCRRTEGPLPTTLGPDATATALAGLTDGEAGNGAVVHSTSWRLGPSGIVLTYAVLPDPDPERGEVRAVEPGATVVCSGDPLAPSPHEVPHGAVVVHACRHLSLLARTNAMVGALAADRPQLWGAVLAHVPDVAGRLSEEGHRVCAAPQG